MKNKNELLKDLKFHFNTKLIIAAFVVEFVILFVLFCFAGGEHIESEGSYALREVLTNAGAASSAQYSDIYSGVTENSDLESFVSKYIADDDVLLSSLSPSLSGYINHEYNVKNYIQGVAGKEDNTQKDEDLPVNSTPDDTNYKYYQFIRKYRRICC